MIYVEDIYDQVKKNIFDFKVIKERNNKEFMRRIIELNNEMKLYEDDMLGVKSDFYIGVID